MTNWIKKLAAISDRVIDLMAFLAALMVVFLVLIVSADAVMRYIVGLPILWASDVVEALLLYILFFGSAWLLREEGHVMVEIVFNRMNPNIQGLLNVVTSVLGAGMCLILTWFASAATWASFQRGVMLIGGITYPKYVLLAPIPLGSFLLTIQFIRRTYGYLKSWSLKRIEQPKRVELSKKAER